VKTRVRSTPLLAAAALALLTAGACKRGAEPLEVRKILIDVAPGAEGPGGVLKREAVRALVEQRVEADRRLKKTDARDAAVLRVRLESAAVTAHEGGQGGTISVSVEATGGTPGALHRYRYRGHAVASLQSAAGAEGSGGLDFKTLFLQAYDQALDQIAGARGAQDKKSEELLAWVADEDLSLDQRRQAIRILGSRKETTAVPALIEVLGTQSRELAPAALGALTLIGDPNAVEAVVVYAENKPSLVRKQAIEATRVMGGNLAKAWLFTLSTGHPDADVRAAAELALRELEDSEREDAPAATLAERAAKDDVDEATP
jgi:hypothetical protein